MRRVITTNEASVRECVISVKTVTVDKRQMTLTVFRQIPVVEFEDLGEAIPWGWVNYWHDKDEPEKRDSTPALFAQGGVLVRSLIPCLQEFRFDLKRSVRYLASEKVFTKLEKKHGRGSVGEVLSDPWTAADGSMRDRWQHTKIYKEWDARTKKLIPVIWKRKGEPAFKQHETLISLLDELGQLYIAT